MATILKWIGGLVLALCLILVGVSLVVGVIAGGKGGADAVAERGGTGAQAAVGGAAGGAAAGLVMAGATLYATGGGILFGAILYFIGRTLERQGRQDRYATRRGVRRRHRPYRHRTT